MNLKSLKKYCNDSRSLKKTDYWTWIAIVAMLEFIPTVAQIYLIGHYPNWSYGIYLNIIKIPVLALYFIAVRLRCNDIGISQFYGYLVLFPYIREIIIIVFGCIKTSAKVNFEANEVIKRFLLHLEVNQFWDFAKKIKFFWIENIIPKILKSYYNVSKKVNRQEYWLVIIHIVIIKFLLTVIGLYWNDRYNLGTLSYSLQLFPLSLLNWLTLIFSFIFARRRCNDIGINYYYSYFVLFPFINFIPLVILGCIRTDAARKTKPSKESKLV